MIVPARIVPPLALLAALLTVTVAYNAGIAEAPRGFFGERDDLVLLLPGTGRVTSTGTVPEDLARVLRTRPDVSAASPEIVVMTAFGDASVFARGVDADAFLAIEEGRITSGRSPTAARDALAGVDLARRFRLSIGDELTLPGSLSETAARVRIVGVFDAPGLPRDELLVSLVVARGLAGLSTGGVHLIRVQTTDPAGVARLAASTQPTFSYSDVRLSTDDVVLGQPIILTANVTNWGVVGGSQEVNIRVENASVVRMFVYVEARQIAQISAPLYLNTPGDVLVSINPTFNVSVREPTAFVDAPPHALVVGEPSELRVVDARGAPIRGLTLAVQADESRTDIDGRATVVPQAAGLARVNLREDGVIVGTAEIVVAPAGYRDLPLLHTLFLSLVDPLVNMNDPVGLKVGLANIGGAAGSMGADILVDGVVVETVGVHLSPGQNTTVFLKIPPLPEGIHRVSVDGLDRVEIVESLPGDPRVEAALRAREAARANPTLAPRVGIEASDYVDRIVRTVAIAATSLTVAAGVLASLAALAVWSRHLAERSYDIGVLKALGASREKARAIVTREATRAAAVATILGIGGGLALVFAIDLTAFVRAFGHRIAPAFGWWPLAVLALSIMAANVGLARLIAGAIYDRAADELLGRRLLAPGEHARPSLGEALRE